MNHNLNDRTGTTALHFRHEMTAERSPSLKGERAAVRGEALGLGVIEVVVEADFPAQSLAFDPTGKAVFGFRLV